MKPLTVPEYDDKLKYVFYATELEIDGNDYRKLLILLKTIYFVYFENRENLINEVRNIADKSVRVKRNCNISYITGSSVGLAAGATAVVGTVMFPPLLVGGLIVAGVASASNIGTHITQFVMFRMLLKKVIRMSEYDAELMKRLDEIYCKIVSSNLPDGVAGMAASSVGKNVPAIGLELGSSGAKGATAVGLGLRSARYVGLETIGIGSRVLKGVARGALGIGIVIDGVTIVFSSTDLVKGSNTKFSEALRKFADEKDAELKLVKRRIEDSGLIADPHINLQPSLVTVRDRGPAQRRLSL